MAEAQELKVFSGNLNFQGTGQALVRGDEYGGMGVTQMLPSGLWLAQHGRTYVASAGVVANAVIPVVDIPTVAAKWVLYNGVALTSKIHLVIHRVSFWYASGTAGVQAGVMIGVGSAAQASAPTAATGSAVKSTSGSTRTTSTILGAAANLGGAAAWTMVASNESAAAQVIGSVGISDDLTGRFLVPPTYGLGISVYATTGTSAKYGVAVEFSEIELDTE